MYENRIVDLIENLETPPAVLDIDEQLEMVYSVLDDLFTALCETYESVAIDFKVKAK